MNYLTRSNFQATSKRVAKGKKVAHTLTQGDLILDTRESARQYGVVVVAVQDEGTIEGLKAHYANLLAANLRNWEGFTRLANEGKSFEYRFPGQRSYRITNREDGVRAITGNVTGPEHIREYWAKRLAEVLEGVAVPAVLGWSRDEKTGAAMGKDYAARGWNILLVPVA